MTTSLLQKSAIATATATAFISIGCLMPEDASAVVITATAQGDTNPAIINGQSLQNGDFSITPNFFTTLGDGIDEFTNWNFDFNSDSNLQTFINAIGQGSLTSAKLTLTLSPRGGFSTDATGIRGVNRIVDLPNIPGIPGVGETDTIVLDLLNDYGFTSTQILGSFNSGNANVIPWYYADDAIISFSQLELEAEDAQSVPEPASIISLLTVGTLGAGSALRKKLSSSSQV